MFNGNVDSFSRVEVLFSNPIEARFLRIIPMSWKNNIAIKFDVITCSVFEDSSPYANAYAPAVIFEEFKNSLTPAQNQELNAELSKYEQLIMSSDQNSKYSVLNILEQQNIIQEKLKEMNNQGKLSTAEMLPLMKNLDAVKNMIIEDQNVLENSVLNVKEKVSAVASALYQRSYILHIVCKCTDIVVSPRFLKGSK